MTKKALAALLLLVALIGAACSSDDDKSDTTTTTEEAMTETTVGDAMAPLEGEQLEVATAWESFFSAEGADAAAFVEARAETADVLTAAAEASANNGFDLKAKVTAVTINGDTADVTYDLLNGEAPLLPGQAGAAIKQEGSWRVSLFSLCALIALGGSPAEACASVEAPAAAG